MAKLSTIVSGIAGEYYVAAERSRRRYIATVKTNQGSKRDWMIDQKVEAEDNSLFFVLVNLNGPDQIPSFHVVPGHRVIVACKDQTEGLAARGVANSVRHLKIAAGDDSHLGNWSVLGLHPAMSV